MGKFKIQPYNAWDKDIDIHGPSDLYIQIDNDDVDQDLVQAAMEEMVAILNTHWTSKTDKKVTTRALQIHLASEAHRLDCETGGEECDAEERLKKRT